MTPLFLFILGVLLGASGASFVMACRYRRELDKLQQTSERIDAELRDLAYVHKITSHRYN